MSETTHASLRAQLVAERDRVYDQLAELGVSRDSYDEGFADSGQVTAERSEVEALVGTLQETLTDIDAALAKFEQGTYGQCESCGGPIGEARLEAMPAARLCIKCASKRR
jgi:RNA polymerase-binding transcription factor DksA